MKSTNRRAIAILVPHTRIVRVSDMYATGTAVITGHETRVTFRLFFAALKILAIPW